MKEGFFAILVISVFVLAGCASVEDSASEVSALQVKSADDPCQDSINETQKHYCYIRQAVHEKDDSYCAKIVPVFYRDICYVQMASWHNLPGLCEKVELPDKKDSCFWGMSVQLSNVSLCQRIRLDAEPLSDRGICIDAASVKNTKPNIRNDSYLEDKMITHFIFITSPEVDKKMIDGFDQIRKTKSWRGSIIPDKGVYFFSLPSGWTNSVFVDNIGSTVVQLNPVNGYDFVIFITPFFSSDEEKKYTANEIRVRTEGYMKQFELQHDQDLELYKYEQMNNSIYYFYSTDENFNKSNVNQYPYLVQGYAYINTNVILTFTILYRNETKGIVENGLNLVGDSEFLFD